MSEQGKKPGSERVKFGSVGARKVQAPKDLTNTVPRAQEALDALADAAAAKHHGPATVFVCGCGVPHCRAHVDGTTTDESTRRSRKAKMSLEEAKASGYYITDIGAEEDER